MHKWYHSFVCGRSASALVLLYLEPPWPRETAMGYLDTFTRRTKIRRSSGGEHEHSSGRAQSMPGERHRRRRRHNPRHWLIAYPSATDPNYSPTRDTVDLSAREPQKIVSLVDRYGRARSTLKIAGPSETSAKTKGSSSATNR